MAIDSYDLDRAAARLREFHDLTEKMPVEVHTLKIVLDDLQPILTIEGTDDDMEDVVATTNLARAEPCELCGSVFNLHFDELCFK